MSRNKRTFIFLLSILFQYFIVGRSSNDARKFQLEVQSSEIPLESATMANVFQDLTANLAIDDNDVTCASSDWVSSRNFEFKMANPTGLHAISLLMHKYVDVDLEVYVKNSSTNFAVCNKKVTNTGDGRELTVTCKQETYGESISLKDMRNSNEFFVICEIKAYGAPSPVKAPEESSGDDQLPKYIGIGCGAALLVVVVVIIIVFLCRRKPEPRRSSEAHSLNTLSMMTSQQAVQRRVPIPSPRPHVVSRSIPNPYDRPTSVKDTTTIYETIPGDEPPYLTLVGEKEIYDDASSSKR